MEDYKTESALRTIEDYQNLTQDKKLFEAAKKLASKKAEQYQGIAKMLSTSMTKLG